MSKSFLFSSNSQTLSIFGKAVGHPARAEMLARLVKKGVLTYSELVQGLPLKKGSINDHLNKLKSARLVKPVLMAHNLAGYSINRKVYDRCLHQMADSYPSFEEEMPVQSEWVRDYEAEFLDFG